MTQPAPDPGRTDPPGQRPRLRFHLPLDPARLLRARQRIRDYLHDHEVEPLVVNDVVLAVEEAMTNAVRHSAAGQDLEVGLSFEGNDLVAEVRDYGRGFDVATFDPNALPDLDKTSGRGLYLISRLMDELTLEADCGVALRAVKRGVLGAAPAPERSLPGVPGAQLYRDARERALLDEIEDEYFAFDWEYHLIHANSVVTRLAGRSLDELRGQTVWALLTPAWEPLAQKVEQAMQLGRPAVVEYESSFVPGRWLEARLYPASRGLSVFSTDITWRKHDEQALAESLRRSQLVARTTARLLSADDPQGVIDDLCREVMEHLGCRIFLNYLLEEEAGCLRLNAWAGIAEEEAGRIACLSLGDAVCGCAAAEGRMPAAENVQGGGDERAALLRSYGVQAYVSHPLLVQEKVLGTLSFGAGDRTSFTPAEISLMKLIADQVAIAVDRQRSRRALQQSEELFRTVVNNISDGLWMYDLRARRCVLINAAEEAHTGYSIDELNAASQEWVDEGFHPEDRQAADAFYALAEGRPAPRSVEYRWRVKSGEFRWFNYRRTLVRDASGMPAAIVSISSDVTDRRRREASQRLLSELAAHLGTLVSAEEIMTAAARRLSRHLEVPVVAVLAVEPEDEVFATRWVWTAQGETSQVPRHTLSEYVDDTAARRLRDGETLVVPDASVHAAHAHARASSGVGAAIVVPLQYQGIWSCSFVVADVAPHPWRDDEIDLVRDVAGVVIPRLARAQAEAALHASEDRLAEILRAAGAGVWDMLVDDSRFTWSAELYDLLGLDPTHDAPTIEAWLRVLHPDDRARVGEELRAALRTGEELNVEYRIIRDGEVRWVNALGRRRPGAAGEASSHIGGICIDVTERKQLEQQVARQQQQAQQLIRNAPAGIFEVSVSPPRFLSANEYIAHFTGYEEQELLAMSVLELLDEEDRERVAGQMRAALAGQEPESSVECRFRTKQGEQRRAVLKISPRAEDGSSAFVVAYDITERAQAEEALRASERRYRQLFEGLREGFVHRLPQVPGLALSALSLSAHRPELIGGDFHDVFALPDGRVMVLIGDVMGKGARAAGLTETVRSAARVVALSTPVPEKILEQVNRLLLWDEYEEFVTALVLIVDPLSGHCALASAGHPGPVLVAGGDPVIVQAPHGPPLGILEGAYEAIECVLPAEAVLVLYTDGLTEARRGGELFGERRLCEALARAADSDPFALAQRLHADVLAWAGELKDDLEILALKRLAQTVQDEGRDGLRPPRPEVAAATS
jgi:PAS domain S-box-containing protein